MPNDPRKVWRQFPEDWSEWDARDRQEFLDECLTNLRLATSQVSKQFWTRAVKLVRANLTT